MKKYFKGFVSGAVIASLGVSAVFAAGGIKSANFNTNKVYFDGRELDLNGQFLVSIVKDGEQNMSNYMPVRGVFEAMGYDVAWDSVRSAVIISSKFKTQEDELYIINEEKYTYWLNEKKKMVDEISNTFIHLNDKKDIEAACSKLMNNDVIDIYVGFSDGTAVFGSDWNLPSEFKANEQWWYELAMDAKGQTASDLPFYDYPLGKAVVTVVKKMNIFEGLDAVLAVDFYVPEGLIGIH